MAGDLFILRRTKALVGAAERLAASNLSARSGIAQGGREINELARAVDNMAEAQEARLLEVQENQKLVEEEADMAAIGWVISSSVELEKLYAAFDEATRRLIPWHHISINLVFGESGTHVSSYSRGVTIYGRQPGMSHPWKAHLPRNWSSPASQCCSKTRTPIRSFANTPI